MQKMLLIAWVLLLPAMTSQAQPSETPDGRMDPGATILHLIYSAPDMVGNQVFWIDLIGHRILYVNGAMVMLRDGGGDYFRGSAMGDFATGAPGKWEADPFHARGLMGVPSPASQAVLLSVERDRTTRVDKGGNEQVVEWRPPPFKVWNYSEETGGPVEVAGAARYVFHLALDGHVLSWQQIVEEPKYHEGIIHAYSYDDAVALGGMLIPKYFDIHGQGRLPPATGVYELETAELLDHAPSGTFTKDRALAVAAEIARPMVESERAGYQWYGDSSGEAGATSTLPFVDPTRKPGGPSWSSALLVAGSLVLAIGVFAWWRSRR